MHLADFLRERLNLTATHLRCEQGACGACTLLIDGQPARSCITFAVLCDGAEITTIEGLEDDPVMAALRRAFSEEHGLQCGYCTPGMLVTARDIVMRLPDADQARIRREISGNLCRCTGYVGIVRAISRVLDERRKGQLTPSARKDAPLGPVGARRAEASRVSAAALSTPAPAAQAQSPVDQSALGLLGRQPNIEIRQSFAVSQPPEAVWAMFADIARVVSCLPGASLTRPPAGELVDGKMSVKLGPITANFAGQARIVRDETRRRGADYGHRQGSAWRLARCRRSRIHVGAGRRWRDADRLDHPGVAGRPAGAIRAQRHCRGFGRAHHRGLCPQSRKPVCPARPPTKDKPKRRSRPALCCGK